jgi:hypothetical protein
MDACAPAPTCGTAANNGSNIWFKFYASATTVTISVFQNTSFVIGVQAFNGGPTCGSLSQIGCTVAGGPSSGANLTLTGLTIGELYYYRIYGSSGPVTQRTGIYCFCGTTGLDNYVLASGLKSFKGYGAERSVKLTWEVANDQVPEQFDVETSSDKILFNTIGTVTAYNRRDYSFTFTPGDNQELYYRLRFTSTSGDVIYSPTLRLKTKVDDAEFITYFQKTRQMRIRLQKNGTYILCGVPGNVVQQFALRAGDNLVTLKDIPNGIYFVKDANGSSVHKIAVMN